MGCVWIFCLALSHNEFSSRRWSRADKWGNSVASYGIYFLGGGRRAIFFEWKIFRQSGRNFERQRRFQGNLRWWSSQTLEVTYFICVFFQKIWSFAAVNANVWKRNRGQAGRLWTPLSSSGEISTRQENKKIFFFGFIFWVNPRKASWRVPGEKLRDGEQTSFGGNVVSAVFPLTLPASDFCGIRNRLAGWAGCGPRASSGSTARWAGHRWRYTCSSGRRCVGRCGFEQACREQWFFFS